MGDRAIGNLVIGNGHWAIEGADTLESLPLTHRPYLYTVWIQ